MNASPRFDEPYDVPSGYFDEEILLLEGVRKHADAHGNTDVLLVVSVALDFVLKITSRMGTREIFISLIDLCTLARTSWPKNQFITDTFEKLAEKVRAGLRANELAEGRK